MKNWKTTIGGWAVAIGLVCAAVSHWASTGDLDMQAIGMAAAALAAAYHGTAAQDAGK